MLPLATREEEHVGAVGGRWVDLALGLGLEIRVRVRVRVTVGSAGVNAVHLIVSAQGISFLLLCFFFLLLASSFFSVFFFFSFFSCEEATMHLSDQCQIAVVCFDRRRGDGLGIWH